MITIDPAALKAAAGAQIFVDLHDVPLRAVLKNMLLPKDLYYDFVDGDVVITVISLRQYDISDLLTQMDAKKLLELIVERTGREKWDGVQLGVSGPPILRSSHEYEPPRMMYVRGNWLMVNNSGAIHAMIEGVLSELREAADKPAKPESAGTKAPADH